jgi:predicted negative regulator of RcsB-dependent stress response
MEPEKSAADQVKDAVWVYTQRTIVALLLFGAGLFLGYQLWGAGEMGQPALAARVEKLDQDMNRVKNEREDCQKVLQVTQTRKEAVEKELQALKAKTQAP